ncbi:hypothetical protein GA0115280_11219, partial [Streptomyces sp. Cmuel-A718b]
MRSCPACGTANGESDDFCGNCGSYLGWSSEPVRRGRTREPEPVPEPGPPRTGDESGDQVGAGAGPRVRARPG